MRVTIGGGIALAVVMLACGLAALLLPPPASCVDQSRNPYRFRDWPHYVGAMDSGEHTARVVLISNSQGYGGEYPAQKVYPARLEALLNERKTGGVEHWEVLNFSLDGVTPMEYMALAARLREEKPTWLISISGSADYRADNFDKGFSFCRTDIPQLLTTGLMASRLPLSFWRRHGRVEDVLTAWVTQRLPLLRLRDYVWSWLDTRFPGAQKAFYAPRTTYRFWQLRGEARTAPVTSPLQGNGESQLDLTYDEKSAVLLGEFIAQLAEVPAGHKLVATSPLRSTFADGREGPWVAAFRADLKRLADEAGLPFWDLTELLPPEDFITSNHLQDRNHKRMAALLEERIASEMGK